MLNQQIETACNKLTQFLQDIISNLYAYLNVQYLNDDKDNKNNSNTITESISLTDVFHLRSDYAKHLLSLFQILISKLIEQFQSCNRVKILFNQFEIISIDPIKTWRKIQACIEKINEILQRIIQQYQQSKTTEQLQNITSIIKNLKCINDYFYNLLLQIKNVEFLKIEQIRSLNRSIGIELINLSESLNAFSSINKITSNVNNNNHIEAQRVKKLEEIYEQKLENKSTLIQNQIPLLQSNSLVYDLCSFNSNSLNTRGTISSTPFTDVKYLKLNENVKPMDSAYSQSWTSQIKNNKNVLGGIAPLNILSNNDSYRSFPSVQLTDTFLFQSTSTHNRKDAPKIENMDNNNNNGNTRDQFEENSGTAISNSAVTLMSQNNNGRIEGINCCGREGFISDKRNPITNVYNPPMPMKVAMNGQNSRLFTPTNNIRLPLNSNATIYNGGGMTRLPFTDTYIQCPNWSANQAQQQYPVGPCCYPVGRQESCTSGINTSPTASFCPTNLNYSVCAGKPMGCGLSSGKSFTPSPLCFPTPVVYTPEMETLFSAGGIIYARKSGNTWIAENLGSLVETLKNIGQTIDMNEHCEILVKKTGELLVRRRRGKRKKLLTQSVIKSSNRMTRARDNNAFVDIDVDQHRPIKDLQSTVLSDSNSSDESDNSSRLENRNRSSLREHKTVENNESIKIQRSKNGRSQK
ncbi:unnamed protein product [Didymodactylos carnosus]|uniref:Uncharacterized protein n=1 Tax=Didymodactylos carnosus TaxID=1234261 RepID=A0A8S2EV55_9BILA|nr:unnamed protein product [Didymodactylos carnosus]CAF4055975.1 unnamed protein product [Didymodactylos carnosus]